MDKCQCNKKKVRTPEEKHAIVSRLNRIAGQLGGIKKMIEEDRYCDDVLIQLAAAEKAIKSLSCLIFESHVKSCLVESVKSGDGSVVEEVVELFKRFQ